MIAVASLPGGANFPLDMLGGLTVLALAPFILVMMTSFVRIIVVLSLVRSAIGTQALPPNTVITGLALVLTLVVMTPTLQRISSEALVPYQQGRIDNVQMAQRALTPLRQFMLRQTTKQDAEFFAKIAHRPAGDLALAPLTVVIPAFVVGELRRGFAIGFSMYLPFIVIDLVVSATLMGLGMFMLSPSVVSLPCKLYLFIMVDGWSAICGTVASSFR
ncbi:MAG: flagellar type III secretion system pore protein FliP [Vulcanimicrobiaceae bacterium]